jgi:hypothetical protein
MVKRVSLVDVQDLFRVGYVYNQYKFFESDLIEGSNFILIYITYKSTLTRSGKRSLF